MPPFRINPDLEAERFAESFAASGRIHIPDFLAGDGSERLLRFLEESEDWRLVFNHGEKLFELDRSTQASLTAEQRELFDRGVYHGAATGFQYRYETLRVPDEHAQRLAGGTLLDQFAQFLSSDEALGFLREVIGDADITFADCQATAYSAGHFLTAHDDQVEGKNRRAAYVMGLSRDWRSEWGGLLTFQEPGSARAEAFVPTFNALNILAVPQPHSVSFVAPFAQRRRYSLTGWLRSGDQP